MGLGLGSILSYWIMNKSSKDEPQIDSDIVVERIKAVKKIVVTEGYFSEVFSYSEAKKYFFDYIQFEKKALLLVKGKAQVMYDLEKMDYQVDQVAKTITLVNIPAPTISIEPEIKYYDIQESTFNAFSKDDYNRLQKTAISKLKDKVKRSAMLDMARDELESTLNDLQIVGKELGWKIVVRRT